MVNIRSDVTNTERSPFLVVVTGPVAAHQVAAVHQVAHFGEPQCSGRRVGRGEARLVDHQLDSTALVGKFHEDQTAEVAHVSDSSGDRDRCRFVGQGIEVGQHLGAGVRAVARRRIRVVAQLPQPGRLGQA